MAFRTRSSRLAPAGGGGGAAAGAGAGAEAAAELAGRAALGPATGSRLSAQAATRRSSGPLVGISQSWICAATRLRLIRCRTPMLSDEIEPPIVPVPIMKVRSTPVEYPIAPK